MGEAGTELFPQGEYTATNNIEGGRLKGSLGFDLKQIDPDFKSITALTSSYQLDFENNPEDLGALGLYALNISSKRLFNPLTNLVARFTERTVCELAQALNCKYGIVGSTANKFKLGNPMLMQDLTDIDIQFLPDAPFDSTLFPKYIEALNEPNRKRSTNFSIKRLFPTNILDHDRYEYLRYPINVDGGYMLILLHLQGLPKKLIFYDSSRGEPLESFVVCEFGMPLRVEAGNGDSKYVPAPFYDPLLDKLLIVDPAHPKQAVFNTFKKKTSPLPRVLQIDSRTAVSMMYRLFFKLEKKEDLIHMLEPVFNDKESFTRLSEFLVRLKITDGSRYFYRSRIATAFSKALGRNSTIHASFLSNPQFKTLVKSTVPVFGFFLDACNMKNSKADSYDFHQMKQNTPEIWPYFESVVQTLIRNYVSNNPTQSKAHSKRFNLYVEEIKRQGLDLDVNKLFVLANKFNGISLDDFARQLINTAITIVNVKNDRKLITSNAVQINSLKRQAIFNQLRVERINREISMRQASILRVTERLNQYGEEDLDFINVLAKAVGLEDFQDL